MRIKGGEDPGGSPSGYLWTQPSVHTPNSKSARATTFILKGSLIDRHVYLPLLPIGL